MTTPQIVIELDGGAQGHYRLTASAERSPDQSASRPYEFTVRATHLESGRTSVVNQLNFLLSWFDVGGEYEDWPWAASWSKTERWLRQVIDLARPAVVLAGARSHWQDLEAALDEDRAEGEWANHAEQTTQLKHCPRCGDELFCNTCGGKV